MDTPGVLSGEKQRIERTYNFIDVCGWFAARCDLILLVSFLTSSGPVCMAHATWHLRLSHGLPYEVGGRTSHPELGNGFGSRRPSPVHPQV